MLMHTIAALSLRILLPFATCVASALWRPLTAFNACSAYPAMHLQLNALHFPLPSPFSHPGHLSFRISRSLCVQRKTVSPEKMRSMEVVCSPIPPAWDCHGGNSDQLPLRAEGLLCCRGWRGDMHLHACAVCR